MTMSFSINSERDRGKRVEETRSRESTNKRKTEAGQSHKSQNGQ